MERPKSVITAEFLDTTFRDSEFTGNLKALALHTNENLAEAAFAVYDRKGIPAISYVVKSKKIGSVEDAHVSFHVRLASLIRVSSELSEDGIATVEMNRKSLRSDIMLLIHSHPFFNHLKPSPADFDTWLALMTKSPNNIEGIFVNKGLEGSLLLYQADPTKQLNTYYQQYSGHNRFEMYRLMEESGIRWDILSLNLKTGQFTEAELAKLAKFTVN